MGYEIREKEEIYVKLCFVLFFICQRHNSRRYCVWASSVFCFSRLSFPQDQLFSASPPPSIRASITFGLHVLRIEQGSYYIGFGLTCDRSRLGRYTVTHA